MCSRNLCHIILLLCVERLGRHPALVTQNDALLPARSVVPNLHFHEVVER